MPNRKLSGALASALLVLSLGSVGRAAPVDADVLGRGDASAQGGVEVFTGVGADGDIRYLQIEARTREDRSRIADLGVSIEGLRSDSVWGFAHRAAVRRLRAEGIRILGEYDFALGRGGHHRDFPKEDQRFHNYDETVAELKAIASGNEDFVRLATYGKSLEGRDLWVLHFNTSAEDLESGQSSKPGAIFMGAHHAREHLSVEIPLMLARYLVEHRGDDSIRALLETRDIWIAPMVNPDGAEFDISGKDYKWWRKNRRAAGGKAYGVDLNRNYSYKWGGSGSSGEPGSETFRGPEPFSEPESAAVRDLVEAHLNAKMLLTFHTFSELVLYPWGHTYDEISNEKDQKTFEALAGRMARWNGYTAQPSHDLYLVSGDTTDWAYGTHGIFAFTFELSPSDLGGGGFYPGAKIIDSVFEANLQPCLYLIDLADDPYRAVDGMPSRWLPSLATR